MKNRSDTRVKNTAHLGLTFETTYMKIQSEHSLRLNSTERKMHCFEIDQNKMIAELVQLYIKING